MGYVPREKGRLHKFFETIAILEIFYETGEWRIDLDEQKQMPRYNRRHYPEYFMPYSKTREAREKRAANKAKAVQIKAEYESGKRVEKPGKKNLSHDRSGVLDFQAESRRRRSS